MIFKKLSIQHFKRLKNATFDFKPGINIIKGDNEAGKSTVKLAFLTGLFSSPRSAATAKNIKSWGADFKSRITLQFETDSSGFALAKDFQEKEVVLVDGKNKRKYEDSSTVQKAIAKLLGIGTQALFESTAYIDHSMVADINKGKKEIRESLGSSLTGAGEDASAEKIIKKLEKIISEMEKGLSRPTTKPGIIKALKDEIKVLSDKSADLGAKAKELEKGSSTFDKVQTELKKAEEEFRTKKELFKSIEKFFKLKEMEERFKKEYSDLEHRIEGIKEDRKKLDQIDEKLKVSGVEIRPEPKWVPFVIIGLIFIILAAVLSFFNIWFMLISLFSIPSFVKAANLILKSKEISEKGNISSQLLNEKKIIEAGIEGKRGKKSISDLEKEWSDVRRKLKDVEDELSQPEMKAVKVESAQFKKLSSDIKKLESEIQVLRDRRASGKTYLEIRNISNTEVAEVVEEVEAKEEELKRQEKRLNVYKLTLSAIEDSFKHTLSPARDVLKQKVEEYFKIITNGRYNKIELEEGSLEFKVYSPEKRNWVSISPKDEELSRGTIDQFFLSARLALVDVISQGKKPPIFLDDPFVTFDNKRLESAMKLLKEISKEHQIFIFTCKNSYDKFSDHSVAINL